MVGDRRDRRQLMITMNTTLLDHHSSLVFQRPHYWFCEHFGDEKSSFLRSIDCLQITVSIADEVNDYLKGLKMGASSPRLRYEKKVLGLYLRMPVEDWRGMPSEHFVSRLDEGIRSAFSKMLRWLRKHGEVMDEPAYAAEFELRMKLFINDALKPMLRGHDMQYWESDRYKALKAEGLVR
jgi:hypothetical protein